MYPQQKNHQGGCNRQHSSYVFVAANGMAAGSNVALLTEIANRAQVNTEMVRIETGARAMALSSRKVDAVFWTKNHICDVCVENRAE